MNEGDKELLEKAAKAAGIKLQLDDDYSLLWVDEGFLLTHSRKVWNPLTNDGDAFRLAVKLKLEIEYYVSFVCASDEDYLYRCFADVVKGDFEKATKLAITRAAAAMADKE